MRCVSRVKNLNTLLLKRTFSINFAVAVSSIYRFLSAFAEIFLTTPTCSLNEQPTINKRLTILQHIHHSSLYAKLAYLLACIACLASSCTSDTTDEALLSKGAGMTFSVSDLTRASVATDIKKFAIYGDMKFASKSPSVLFNKTEVVYTNGEWSYDGVQYWYNHHEHSFVAISPVSVLEAEGAPTYADSKLSFSYAIPAPGGILSRNEDVADILVSTHRRHYESEQTSDPTVSFTFGHVLSLINFAPAFSDDSMGDDAYIMISELRFSGITTKAKFDILPAELQSNNQTDDRNIGITGQETGDLTIRLTTPVKIGNNAQFVNLFPANDAIIMLPQILNADASVTISFTISGEEKPMQAVLPLTNLKWESGSSQTYKFTIERTGAKFVGAEINPWNEIKGEDNVVD